MVDHGQIQRFAGVRQGPRRAAVDIARGRVPARVIVRQDDTGAAKPCGIGDDLAHRQADRVALALVAAQVNAARLVVEMRDQQLLLDQGFIEIRREERARGLVAGEGSRVFGTLNLHGQKLVALASASHANLVHFGAMAGVSKGWTGREARLG